MSPDPWLVSRVTEEVARHATPKRSGQLWTVRWDHRRFVARSLSLLVEQILEHEERKEGTG